jgi:hypothetical protein
MIMSCYEWERGDVRLSTKEYARVKKTFIAIIKEDQTQNLNLANKLYNKIVAEAKGKRGVDYSNLYHNCRFEKSVSYSTWGTVTKSKDLDPADTFWTTCVNHENSSKRPLKPKKKDFLSKIDRKNLNFEHDDFSIQFIDRIKTISWIVEENNHAKDRAHEHPVAKKLFNLLNGVKWTRGTGGTIVGNDEYNQDSDFVGGGGNYITMSFGPIGEQSRKDFVRSLY